MKVIDLERYSKVPADAIRHYTGMGLLRPKRDPSNGYRYYQPADVERVRFIYKIKTLGFRLAEIGQILSHTKKGKSSCPDVRDIVQTRIDENRQKLNELEMLQTHMENTLDQWRAMPNKAPDGDSIGHLIESVTEIVNGA